MARILLLEPDPVFRALLEDWLHVASHRCEVADSPDAAQELAAQGEIDALILELNLGDGVSGLETIRVLRAAPRTQQLPVIVISHRREVADRVEALRTGADDYLTKPCDSEELTLRLEKLLQRRSIDPSALEGHLDTHSPWDLVQFLQNSTKSGDLLLHGDARGASITVHQGVLVAARWERLSGAEALLAILGQTEGSFRFLQKEVDRDLAADGALPTRQLLIEAAWIEDEISQRLRYLPVRGVPLQPTGRSIPDFDEHLAALPFSSILEAARGPTPVRLYDLEQVHDVAPRKIALAVACLVETEVLLPLEEDHGAEVLTGQQIHSLQVLESASSELLRSERGRRSAPVTLSYLLVAEPAAWHRLEALFVHHSENERTVAFQRIREQLRRGLGGSVALQTDRGRVSFHSQMLRSSTRKRIDAVTPVCRGVVLWVEDLADLDMVRSFMERVADSPESVSGVVVTTAEGSRKLRNIGAAARRWRIAEQNPQGLLGVIRLLQTP